MHPHGVDLGHVVLNGALLIGDRWVEESSAGTAEHINPQGVLHGGILMTFADHGLSMLAWEAAQIAAIKIPLGPLSPSMVTAGLSALLLLFTLIKVLTNSYVATWAWIGLVLAAGIAAGAWLNMKAAGESLSDLKTSVTAAASHATAGAKTAAASRPQSSSAPATPSRTNPRMLRQLARAARAANPPGPAWGSRRRPPRRHRRGPGSGDRQAHASRAPAPRYPGAR